MNDDIEKERSPKVKISKEVLDSYRHHKKNQLHEPINKPVWDYMLEHKMIFVWSFASIFFILPFLIVAGMPKGPESYMNGIVFFYSWPIGFLVLLIGSAIYTKSIKIKVSIIVFLLLVLLVISSFMYLES